LKTPRPHISIVIPTHNRLPILRKTLMALARQSYPVELIQVVVVADGCHAGYAEAIETAGYPFDLTVLSQAGAGAGAARNRGVEIARGDLLIFLDDDVVPTGNLVEAHVKRHEERPGGVVIGPSIMPPEAIPTYFGSALRRWWVNVFEALNSEAHRFTYRDLLGGNFSVSANLFRRVGGFDERFRSAREDGELGARFLLSGSSFSYAPEALGEHQENADLRHCIRRWRHEGAADVRMARLHPELRSEIRIPRGRMRTIEIIIRYPRIADYAVNTLAAMLSAFEKVNNRKLWNGAFARLFLWQYWRGVADELAVSNPVAGFIALLEAETEGITASEVEEFYGH
jgi:GT2 family glycosyltransferase